ncbi:unnamed protein product, partial [Ixodes pacificus]
MALTSVRCCASSGLTLVARAVWATLTRRSRSGVEGAATLRDSSTSRALAWASSKPSARMRGCRPCNTPTPPRSACLRSSPMMSTVEVVPSPVMSFWAVDARAIRLAVGS